MKVLSFNLRADANRWQERFPLVVNALYEADADIIGLQEVRLKIEQANIISEALNERMEHPYEVFLCVDWYQPHILANAFLSRIPIQAHERLELPEGYRTAQRLLINYTGQTIQIANTHLHHKPYNDKQIRRKQMQTILNWLDAPFILMGDMNARPNSSTIALAKEHAQSAYATAHGGEPDYTFPTPLRTDKVLAKRTIDYIFVHDHLHVNDATLIGASQPTDDPQLYISDHLGICATIS